jgi:hypothetical protein
MEKKTTTQIWNWGNQELETGSGDTGNKVWISEDSLIELIHKIKLLSVDEDFISLELLLKELEKVQEK